MEVEFTEDPVDKNIVPVNVVTSLEIDFSVRYEDAMESYMGMTLNQASPDYIEKRMGRSELVKIVCTPDSTNWGVFEPNDSNLWRSGMLTGGFFSEAYFVEIGPSTLSWDDIMAAGCSAISVSHHRDRLNL